MQFARNCGRVYGPRVTDLSTHYLSQAAGSSEHWSGPPEMVERIAAYATTGPGCRVMDAGCGIGGPARRLAKMTGCEVMAVDLLPRLLSIATTEQASDAFASLPRTWLLYHSPMARSTRSGVLVSWGIFPISWGSAGRRFGSCVPVA